MSINLQAFRQSLVFMGEGMLGIFAVTPLLLFPIGRKRMRWTATYNWRGNHSTYFVRANRVV